MKDKDTKLLEEAYKNINEAAFPPPGIGPEDDFRSPLSPSGRNRSNYDADFAPGRDEEMLGNKSINDIKYVYIIYSDYGGYEPITYGVFETKEEAINTIQNAIYVLPGARYDGFKIFDKDTTYEIIKMPFGPSGYKKIKDNEYGPGKDAEVVWEGQGPEETQEYKDKI